MRVNVKTIYDVLFDFAPLSLAMENDNCGLIIGAFENEVYGVLTCLDIREVVVDEAIAKKANLIISHHPIIFYPTKTLNENIYENSIIAKCIRNNINVIAMHTNLDACEGGINDFLAKELGLINIKGNAFFRIGDNSKEIEFSLFEKIVTEYFSDKKARIILPKAKKIKKVAIASGSGGRDDNFIKELKENGVEVLITGEVKHSIAIKLAYYGIGLIEIGHYYTENCSKKIIAKLLFDKFANKKLIGNGDEFVISESNNESSPYKQ